MKKFIIIICLSLMGFSIASQISFNSGMLSEILKFRIDFDKRSMALEDSENMLVQPEGPIFRRTGTEFIDEALTEFSYTVTDTNDSNDPNTPVYGDYTEYFVGYQNFSGYNCLLKAKTDGTLNTDWGTNGFWGYTNAFGSSGGCRGILQLSNGRLLVSLSPFYIEGASYLTGGKKVVAAMLDVNGDLDTTWGYNGFYIIENGTEWQYPMADAGPIFQCNDGNFVMVGIANSGSKWNYHKFDTNGTLLIARAYDTAPSLFDTPYDAIWSDDTHTRLLICDDSASGSVLAINPDTLEIDTDWGISGYFTGVINSFIYNIINVDDGYVALVAGGADCYKILSDGSGLDTSWGTNGYLTLDYTIYYPSNVGYSGAWDGTNLYTLTALSDTKVQNLRKISAAGVILDTETFTQASLQNNYHSIQTINDNLLFGTVGGAYEDIEIWSKDFTYLDSFSVAGDLMYYNRIIPDESTREVTYTGGGDGETTTTTVTTLSSDKTRLIPFQFSVSDAYVLEFGNKFVSFLRTE